MSKELTTLAIDRQNILNNPYALEEIQKAAGIQGITFEGEIKFLKEQLAAFFEVDTRTIDRYLEKHIDELSKNGYEVLRGKRLQEFKLAIKTGYVDDINNAQKKIKYNWLYIKEDDFDAQKIYSFKDLISHFKE